MIWKKCLFYVFFLFLKSQYRRGVGQAPNIPTYTCNCKGLKEITFDLVRCVPLALNLCLNIYFCDMKIASWKPLCYAASLSVSEVASPCFKKSLASFYVDASRFSISLFLVLSTNFESSVLVMSNIDSWLGLLILVSLPSLFWAYWSMTISCLPNTSFGWDLKLFWWVYLII